jgi:hypothetical protein
MKDVDTCICKENDTFYLDIHKWKNISDITIQIGDIFNFTFDNKKYLVKVIDVNFTDAKLKIL